MAKKRNKKYHRRPSRPAAMLYRIEDLTPERRTELYLKTYVALEAIRSGEGTLRQIAEIQSSLYHAWILARGFEEKEDMRKLFTLAYACLNCAFLCTEKDMEIPEAVFEAIQQAVDIYKEMMDNLSRAELLASARVAADNNVTFYRIPNNAGWLVKPRIPPDDPTIGRPGYGIVNGKLRNGYLRRNPEMDDRLEWVCTDEGNITVHITKPFVLLLDTPLSDEEVGECEN